MDQGQVRNLPELALDRSWSIGEEAFVAIISRLGTLQPKTIVEFGSGASSVRLAAEFPEARILSIENDPVHAAAVRKLAEKAHLPEARLRVEVRPLEWVLFRGRLYQTYSKGPFPAEIDAVVVDGPPLWTRRGREVCLYMVAERLRLGAEVYLDDYQRPHERRIAQNWLLSYPGAFELTVIPSGHSLCVLRKRKQLGLPRYSLRVSIDSVLQNARRMVGNVRKRTFGTRSPARQQ